MKEIADKNPADALLYGSNFKKKLEAAESVAKEGVKRQWIIQVSFRSDNRKMDNGGPPKECNRHNFFFSQLAILQQLLRELTSKQSDKDGPLHRLFAKVYKQPIINRSEFAESVSASILN
ncbi:unnamed protein product [Allacma fusca]|uniref:Uncharacterized protein n=1 Tax=Allacma fusca TaxID=39272 RepID=A0A8J2LLS3_9HEXA|nr:unnamed protein product [Allacma fusca]